MEEGITDCLVNTIHISKISYLKKNYFIIDFKSWVKIHFRRDLCADLFEQQPAGATRNFSKDRGQGARILDTEECIYYCRIVK